MKSLNEEVALLRTVPFFSSLETGKLKLLAYASDRQGFEEGDIVFRQGTTETDVYFILEGAADVLAETETGPTVVARLPRYALFGEISAFCNVPRTATIRASGHLITLRIPGDRLLELIRESPAAALEVIRVLALRLVDTTKSLTTARREKDRAGQPVKEN